jgi:CMP-N-acetylneuraminic acid synthetase
VTALAVVLARGGSKGLPGKNLLPVAGKPLLAWSVEAALQAARVDRVVVSSDDAAILAAARDAGAETLQRPAHLAQDDTTSEASLIHAWQEAGRGEDVLVLLQPTSPLRTAADVDDALALLDRVDVDAVISVVEPDRSPWKCFYADENGHLRGLVDDDTPFRPRQELPRAFAPNGAIYAVRSALFEATGRLFQPRTVPFEMPAERGLDVDTADDLARAEAMLTDASRQR